MTADQRKLLEAAVQAMDGQAKEHGPQCGLGNVLRAAGDAIRGALAEQTSGPAQVATDAYRNGWETLFGKKQPVGQA